MPRNPRLFVPRATYHVYCSVARGEYVFDSDEEAIEFVDVLRRVQGLDGLTIVAWRLMANHYHLVVTTGDIELRRSMARLQATLALARYRLRTRDLADLLEKNCSTVTRWLNASLKREREDDDFIRRLDTLDHAISSHDAENAPMRYVAPQIEVVGPGVDGLLPAARPPGRRPWPACGRRGSAPRGPSSP